MRILLKNSRERRATYFQKKTFTLNTFAFTSINLNIDDHHEHDVDDEFDVDHDDDYDDDDEFDVDYDDDYDSDDDV